MTAQEIARRHPLATKTGIELLRLRLMYRGAMCGHCGRRSAVGSSLP